MNKITTLFFLLVLVGCSAEREPLELTNKPTNPYPPVSISVNKNVDNIVTTCSQYSCYDQMDSANQVLFEEIKSSGVFERTVRRNSKNDFHIDVTYANVPKGNALIDITKMLVSTATLLTVPAYTEKTFYAHFDIYYNDKVIAEYEYEEVVEEVMHISRKINNSYEPAAEKIANNFLNDIIKDKVFENPDITQTLLDDAQ